MSQALGANAPGALMGNEVSMKRTEIRHAIFLTIGVSLVLFGASDRPAADMARIDALEKRIATLQETVCAGVDTSQCQALSDLALDLKEIRGDIIRENENPSTRSATVVREADQKLDLIEEEIEGLSTTKT